MKIWNICTREETEIVGFFSCNIQFAMERYGWGLPVNDTRFKVNVCNMWNSNLIKKILDRSFILFYFSYNLNT